MLEHPAITRILSTGRPCVEDYSVLHCEKCGSAIREEEPYYDFGDTIYCQDCVDNMKRYA